MSFCRNCGRGAEPAAIYCAACGNPLKEAALPKDLSEKGKQLADSAFEKVKGLPIAAKLTAAGIVALLILAMCGVFTSDESRLKSLSKDFIDARVKIAIGQGEKADAQKLGELVIPEGRAVFLNTLYNEAAKVNMSKGSIEKDKFGYDIHEVRIEGNEAVVIYKLTITSGKNESRVMRWIQWEKRQGKWYVNDEGNT